MNIRVMDIATESTPKLFENKRVTHSGKKPIHLKSKHAMEPGRETTSVINPGDAVSFFNKLDVKAHPHVVATHHHKDGDIHHHLSEKSAHALHIALHRKDATLASLHRKDTTRDEKLHPTKRDETLHSAKRDENLHPTKKTLSKMRGGTDTAGEAEHEAFKDHTKNPFHKILTKHGFVHKETKHEKNRFAKDNPKADDTIHVYTHPAHGKSTVHAIQHHGKVGGNTRDFSYRRWHEQSNGIMVPSYGDTKGQLDKGLTREYGEPKVDNAGLNHFGTITHKGADQELKSANATSTLKAGDKLHFLENDTEQDDNKRFFVRHVNSEGKRVEHHMPKAKAHEIYKKLKTDADIDKKEADKLKREPEKFEKDLKSGKIKMASPRRKMATASLQDVAHGGGGHGGGGGGHGGGFGHSGGFTHFGGGFPLMSGYWGDYGWDTVAEPVTSTVDDGDNLEFYNALDEKHPHIRVRHTKPNGKTVLHRLTPEQSHDLYRKIKHNRGDKDTAMTINVDVANTGKPVISPDWEFTGEKPVKLQSRPEIVTFTEGHTGRLGSKHSKVSTLKKGDKVCLHEYFMHTGHPLGGKIQLTHLHGDGHTIHVISKKTMAQLEPHLKHRPAKKDEASVIDVADMVGGSKGFGEHHEHKGKKHIHLKSVHYLRHSAYRAHHASARKIDASNHPQHTESTVKPGEKIHLHPMGMHHHIATHHTHEGREHKHILTNKATDALRNAMKAHQEH